MSKCLNCGYIRQREDDPGENVRSGDCPKCGALYDNVARLLHDKILRRNIKRADFSTLINFIKLAREENKFNEFSPDDLQFIYDTGVELCDHKPADKDLAQALKMFKDEIIWREFREERKQISIEEEGARQQLLPQPVKKMEQKQTARFTEDDHEKVKFNETLQNWKQTSGNIGWFKKYKIRKRTINIIRDFAKRTDAILSMNPNLSLEEALKIINIKARISYPGEEKITSDLHRLFFHMVWEAYQDKYIGLDNEASSAAHMAITMKVARDYINMVVANSSGKIEDPHFDLPAT